MFKWFAKMKLKSKLTLGSLSIFFMSMTIIVVMVILNTISQANKDIETFKKNELDKYKQGLKNYVDIAYETIEAHHKNSTDLKYLEKRYGHRLKSIIDVAGSIIQNQIARVKAGKIKLDEAQKIASQEIKRIRYDNGIGYIWINDTQLPYPNMIMHPTIPALDGKILNDPKYNVALRKKQNLFQAFVEVCNKHGEGFVNYKWPKPTKKGLTRDQPKLSYVRLFKEWNWIIGTGIYVDDAVKDAQIQSLQTLEDMRYDNKQGYFWVNDTQKKLPNMLMHPVDPTLVGKVLDDKKYYCVLKKHSSKGLKKDQHLLEAAVEVGQQKKGEGYVHYRWTRPNSETAVEKLSYVKMFKQWNWIVGTGVYIDDIDNEVIKKTKMIDDQIFNLLLFILGITVFIIIIAIILSYLFSKSIFNQLGEEPAVLVEIAQQIADGDLNVKLDSSGKMETGVFAAMKQMVENLNKISDIAKNIAEGELDIDFDSGRHIMSSSSRTTGLDIAPDNGPANAGNLEDSNLNDNIFMVMSNMVKNLNKIAEISKRIADGDLSVDFETHGKSASNIFTIMKNMVGNLGQVAETAKMIAEGDLDVEFQITNKSEDNIFTIMKHMVDNLNLIADTAKKIGDGDLNVSFHAGDKGEHNFFSIMKSMVDNLNLIADTSQKISDGQLSMAFVAHNWKSGTIFSVMASMIQNLVNVVSEIIEVSSNLAANSQEINATADNFNEGAQNQAAGVEETTAATQELSASIRNVSENAMNMRKMTKDSLKEANIYKETIQQVSEEMVNISASSEKIGEIIKIINDIADQTKLLSLNAAIEAARAGEHGRGFAVVADAISSLASSSAESTKEIEVLIRDSVNRVNHGVESVRSSGISFDSIISNIEGNFNLATEIANSMEEQARGSGQIQKASEEINQLAQTVTAGAEEMASSTIELNNLAERLNEVVATFQINKVDSSLDHLRK